MIYHKLYSKFRVSVALTGIIFPPNWREAQQMSPERLRKSPYATRRR